MLVVLLHVPAHARLALALVHERQAPEEVALVPAALDLVEVVHGVAVAAPAEDPPRRVPGSVARWAEVKAGQERFENSACRNDFAEDSSV